MRWQSSHGQWDFMSLLCVVLLALVLVALAIVVCPKCLIASSLPATERLLASVEPLVT